MFTFLQNWYYLVILSVGTTHLRVYTDCKIFRNAAEGPHILPNTGIFMLSNDTEACGPCPKAWTQHWHIQRDLGYQRRAAYLTGN